MNFNNEWGYKEFIKRENNIIHAPFNNEFLFYEAVKSGNVKEVSKLCETSIFTEKKGLGKLSEIPLRNSVYHFIITCALIARYCIDGGMEHEIAYGLSDFYIQKADKCSTCEDISKLHNIMTMDYTKRMLTLQKNNIYSKPIDKCINYIYNNLHTRITVVQLADYIGLNPSYLSKLFKKETGISISIYIQTRKIEAAQNMLKYSEYSISEIASTLAFTTQSYFTEVFRKKVGMSPKKYRELCYRDTAIHSIKIANKEIH